jgi:hypothetical protein
MDRVQPDVQDGSSPCACGRRVRLERSMSESDSEEPDSSDSSRST